MYTIFDELDNLLKGTTYTKVDAEDKIATTEKHLKVFKNPHKKFRTIHVAGSKGKGTVSTTIATMIDKSGLRTGLYTSPFIVDYHERINLVSEFVKDEVFRKNISLIREKIADGSFKPYTFFEILTVLAFLCFADEKVDIAVIETGIGGRYDCTNVVYPIASVITHIELEHTDLLGSTISQIAYQKAGIIKMFGNVYVLDQSKEVLNVIQNYASVQSAKVKIINPKENFNYLIEDQMSFSIDKKVYSIIVKNPTRAFCYNYIFGCLVSIDLGYVPKLGEFPKVYLRGRFEILKYADGTHIVLDIAHTKNSIENSVAAFYNNYLKGVVICSFIADKNYEMLSDEIFKHFDNIIITQINEYKKSNEDLIYEYLVKRNDEVEAKKSSNKKGNRKNAKKDIRLIKDNKSALDEAKKYSMPILIIGSTYLISSYYKIMYLL